MLEKDAFTDSGPPATEIIRFNENVTTVQAFFSGQVDLIVTGNAIAAETIWQNLYKVLSRNSYSAISLPCWYSMGRNKFNELG